MFQLGLVVRLLAERQGYAQNTHFLQPALVDTRSPPGHPLNTTSLNQIRFLRALAKEEGQETLAKCTDLIYVRLCFLAIA